MYLFSFPRIFGLLTPAGKYIIKFCFALINKICIFMPILCSHWIIFKHAQNNIAEYVQYQVWITPVTTKNKPHKKIRIVFLILPRGSTINIKQRGLSMIALINFWSRAEMSMWLGRLEIWLVCIETCSKCKLHSKFQRLSMKNESYLMNNFYYILKWYLRHNGLKWC